MEKFDRKKIILDSAKNTFTEKGYDGTSVGEIAKGAGLSKASLYYHYTSKEEILYELVKRTLFEIANYINEDLDKTTFSNQENRVNIANKVFEIMEKENDVFKIALIEGLKNNSDQNMIFNLLKSIFEEYDNIFEISNEDKSVVLILCLSFVVFSSLKNKMSESFNIDINELESIFKNKFAIIFSEIIKNSKERK